MTGRSVLKTWFLTGEKPTQGQFAELINSVFNLNDDTISIAEIAGLATALGMKVTAVPGYGLSSNDYTTAEKSKLAALNNYFVGVYSSSAALATAHPTGTDGQYAVVESSGHDAVIYAWDTTNNHWAAGGTGSVTSVNSQVGAVVLSTDNIGEGTTNKYFTNARALAAIPTASQTTAGILETASNADAIGLTDDTKALTPLQGAALFDQKKKTRSYQVNPVSLNEVSILMEFAGQINSSLISGASNLKFRTGLSGTYPSGAQTYPYTYAAGDRIFLGFTYTDLTNASCNIKLKCQDN